MIIRKSHVSSVIVLIIGLPILSGCGQTGDSDEVTLSFKWWGSDTRHQATQEIIDEFEAQNPDISIDSDFGEWGGYWDQLATQVAGNDAPDVIQMDAMYLSEYADRGTLLELEDVDVSQVDDEVVANGETADGLYAVTTGVNVLTLMANPALFEEAGVEIPDDTTWTWDDFEAVTAELSAELDGAYGTTRANEPALFQVWLRQNGKSLTVEDGGLGFDESDAEDYFNFHLDLKEAGSYPPAGLMVEDQQAGLEDSLAGQGNVALSTWWSNQLAALSSSSGVDLIPLQLPSNTGSAEDGQLWLKSSMFLSASSNTDHPEEAQQFIDFFVNSEQAGKLNLMDRGVSPNPDVREAVAPLLEGQDAVSAEFLSEVEDVVGPAEPVDPIGFSGFKDTIDRYHQEVVLFENMTPAEGSDELMRELNDQLE